MFKEEVIKTENGFIIKITAEKIREYSFEQKEVYRKEVESLLPAEQRSSLQLVSAPEKMVSNYHDENFLQTAEWVFEKVSKKPRPKTKKPRTPPAPNKPKTPARRARSRKQPTANETKK